MRDVICEKSKTRCPAALSFGSIESRRTNLPEARMKASSATHWSVRKRYGWLTTLRSCIKTLFRPRGLASGASSPALRRFREDFESASSETAWTPAERICSYKVACHAVKSHLRTFSTLSGSCPSTLALMRRSTNGLSTSCSLLMIKSRSSWDSAAPSAWSGPAWALENSAKGLLNQPSKVSAEEKMLGSKKFKSAHSSGKEFCNGVPVSKSRRLAVYCDPSV
mmetsp:Transcript_20996/g.71124  ORF Transcript_20996/g.71124 Transcript_20996/m.71124 type:complete len:223 (-) Transcript_20996:1237-1905(-)